MHHYRLNYGTVYKVKQGNMDKIISLYLWPNTSVDIGAFNKYLQNDLLFHSYYKEMYYLLKPIHATNDSYLTPSLAGGLSEDN